VGKEQSLKNEKMETIKNEKQYNVSIYFDDCFESVVVKGLTKEEAEKRARELNDMKPRAYVQYIVRQD
jgi:hypothetical protein